MTKGEFEADYAKRSGSTVEALKKLGLDSYACQCGDPTCKGWVMLTKESAEHCRALGQLVDDVFEPKGEKN